MPILFWVGAIYRLWGAYREHAGKGFPAYGGVIYYLSIIKPNTETEFCRKNSVSTEIELLLQSGSSAFDSDEAGVLQLPSLCNYADDD